MTELWELIRDDFEPEVLDFPMNGEMVLGFRARLFLEQGANDESSQRNQALAAARNLIAIGVEVGDATEQIWEALAKSPQLDPAHPWKREQAEKLVVSIATSPAPPLPPLPPVVPILIDHHKIEVEAEEDAEGTFRFVYPEHGVVVEISRVVAGTRATLAWVRATVEGVEVGAAECELRTAAGALGMVRFFDQWGAKPWKVMLERARCEVLTARRIGGVAVLMADILAPARARLRVWPLIVNGHLNVIFASGGSGKSLLMLLLASLIQEGRAHAGMTVEPGNVLYLDWEQGAEDAKETLTALAAGIGGVGNFRYMRCTGTLTEMAEEIGRLIVLHDIEVVMIDSLTFALGGDKNDAATVTAGTNAMRQWREGTTTVALDHVAKGSGADPFGSIFVKNAARNLLKIDAWMDTERHELHQVIEQTKTNKGTLPVFGLKYTFVPESFAPEAIFVEEEDPPFDVAAKLAEKTAVERVAKGPQRTKVYEYIKGNPGRMWSKSALSQALGIGEDTVKSALTWLVNEGMLGEQKGQGRNPNVYFTITS